MSVQYPAVAKLVPAPATVRRWRNWTAVVFRMPTIDAIIDDGPNTAVELVAMRAALHAARDVLDALLLHHPGGRLDPQARADAVALLARWRGENVDP